MEFFTTTTVTDLIAIGQTEQTIRTAVAEGCVVVDGMPMLSRSESDWLPVSPVARALLSEASAVPAPAT